MSNKQRIAEFIATLVETRVKMTLAAFFVAIHAKFYSNYDISFMEYFLELTEHEGEFVVLHEKLIEYGIMTSCRSSNVKTKLDALGLIEDEDFSLLLDIQQQWEGSRGAKHVNIYMLTPEAFKTCLMRARRYPNQTVDPTAYSKYYLLLEKIHKFYTDYEKLLIAKELEDNKKELVETQQKLEEAEFIRAYEEDVYKRLVINNIPIEPTEVLYIATSKPYANTNFFKVGGTQSVKHLSGRLSTYNTGLVQKDEFFYTNTYLVCNFREMEKRTESLLYRFRDKKTKEIYVIHYDDLVYVIEYIISHANDEIEEINRKLDVFIRNLNLKTRKPAIVKPIAIPQISIQEEIPDEVTHIHPKYTEIENHVISLNPDTRIVNAKDIFDFLKIKTGRRGLYPILAEIMAIHLPQAKMVKY